MVLSNKSMNADTVARILHGFVATVLLPATLLQLLNGQVFHTHLTSVVNMAIVVRNKDTHVHCCGSLVEGVHEC